MIRTRLIFIPSALRTPTVALSPHSADGFKKKQLGNLMQANVKVCSTFLEERAGQVGQKTLDRDRQAIQYLLTRTTRMEIRLPRIKSTYSGGRQLAKQSRAYTRDQVQFICSNLSGRSALATRIAYAAGLRGHELYTLQRRSERGPSPHRKWSKDRFCRSRGCRLYGKRQGRFGTRGTHSSSTGQRTRTQTSA